MIDRNNIDNIFNIVKEDFNWLKEDIQQHIFILKESMKKSIDDDMMDDFDDYKEKYQDLSKIVDKLDELRGEYISIAKDEEEQDLIVDGIEYDYLNDWTGTDPIKILLFKKTYTVRYWRDILLTLLEELYNKDKQYIDKIVKDNDFKERSRIPYTFDKNKINPKLYKNTSFGLYVLVNDNANTIYSRCIRLLEHLGYSEDDLKIKLGSTGDETKGEQITIEDNNSSDNNIKLSKKYASISINRLLFKTLINSIVDRKTEYGADYIEPRKIAEKYETMILSNTKYTLAYHVVINIIKYLVDIHFLDNYKDTKRGKYIVIDDKSLKSWIDKNI